MIFAWRQGHGLQLHYYSVEMDKLAGDPILLAGFEYWSNLPRKADIPDRRDVDPTQMPRNILPNIALLEIVDDGADAVVRLAGQEVEVNFGISLRGKTMSQLTEGDYWDHMLGHLRRLVDERKVVYSESAFRWDQGGQLRTRKIIMPLSDGAPEAVAMAIVVQTLLQEQIGGSPFREVILDATGVEISDPKALHPKDA